MNKPPLGLKPRKIFLAERHESIKQAINRRFEVNQEIPQEWIEEYNQICAELNKGNVRFNRHHEIAGLYAGGYVENINKLLSHKLPSMSMGAPLARNK